MNISCVNSSLRKSQHETWWRKCLAFVCPCFMKKFLERQTLQDEQPVEQNNVHEASPVSVPELVVVDDSGGVTSPLIVQTRLTRGAIDNDGMTCDTVLVKNEDSEQLTDENDVTIQQSSCQSEQPSSSSYHTPTSIRLINLQRNRSSSEGHILIGLPSKDCTDNKSLR